MTALRAIGCTDEGGASLANDVKNGVMKNGVRSCKKKKWGQVLQNNIFLKHSQESAIKCDNARPDPLLFA